MPWAALPACRVSWCPHRGQVCPEHGTRDQQRPNAATRRWYHTPRWRALRAWVLATDPWCVACRAAGRLKRATIADHVTPHHGSADLFWSRENLQGLCAACHQVKTNGGA